MARIVLLDTGVLGMVSHPRPNRDLVEYALSRAMWPAVRPGCRTRNCSGRSFASFTSCALTGRTDRYRGPQAYDSRIGQAEEGGEHDPLQSQLSQP